MQNNDFSFENLKKFVYLDYVLKETTRFYGPDGLFIRKASADHFMNSIPIFKDTFLVPWAKANHHNPKYFKDPENFRPERWES